jgi:hypothetical protein
MDKLTAITAIESKLELLSETKDTREFNIWQKGALLTLINIYNEDDKRIKTFESIRSYSDYGFAGLDRFPDAKSEAESLLKSLIADLSCFDLKKAESKDRSRGININVNQHNNQTQTSHINIHLDFLVDILKDELKGSQIKELKTIIESNDSPEEKKKSFIDKIKSFGSDVASNILANILTNPTVYEQLGGML